MRLDGRKIVAMNDATATKAVTPAEVTSSDGLADWLADNDISITFSDRAAGRLSFTGVDGENPVSLFERRYVKPRGLAARNDSLLMGSDVQIWRLENALAEGQTAEAYDRLYVPQAAYTCGEIQTRDLDFADSGSIVFVSTLFNCLATTSDEFSFVPVWRPHFITDLVPEDRCHLTGMAMEDGIPRYVSVAAISNEKDGWKREVARGGCVIDTLTDEIVARGMSLPMSPRLYRDRLWIHDAGTGWFGYADRERSRFERLAFCPGFLRGLAFAGDYAVCSVSRTREVGVLDGLALNDNLQHFGVTPQCALLVIKLDTGEIAHWLRLQAEATEIYDVALLNGARRPAAIGLDDKDISRVLSIGPEGPDGRSQKLTKPQ
jgi:protein O-GlcNAc transferase